MGSGERNAEYWAKRAIFHALALLPTDWVSNIGSHGIRRNVRLNRPEIIANARANLARHRPGASPAELEGWIEEFLDGVGRIMAEFSVIHRFLREGRLEIEGLEAFRTMAGREPIIAIGLHTGNWETFGPVFQQAGIPLTSFYQPPEDLLEREVAVATRRRFGVELLRPDASGVREGMRRLRTNRVVMIFPDEARDGHTMGPLFGRAPHESGNLSIAARLARHTGARFVICHSERTAGCRFRLRFGAPFALPERVSQDRLADVAFLNGAVEPVVAANIPRWYFLDDSIAPIAPKT
ncbi:MAG: lysophospholipid acyltransferase family protein [Rhabdaerophilum sp.]